MIYSKTYPPQNQKRDHPFHKHFELDKNKVNLNQNDLQVGAWTTDSVGLFLISGKTEHIEFDDMFYRMFYSEQMFGNVK